MGFRLADVEKTTASFFRGSSIWEGPMMDFVNMKDGVVQHGRMIMK